VSIELYNNNKINSKYFLIKGKGHQVSKINKNNQEASNGRPWKTAASFSSYADADEKRNDLLKNNKNMQTKVRRRRAQETYTVLYRDPVPAKVKAEKKAPSKKRARKQQK